MMNKSILHQKLSEILDELESGNVSYAKEEIAYLINTLHFA